MSQEWFHVTGTTAVKEPARASPSSTTTGSAVSHKAINLYRLSLFSEGNQLLDVCDRQQHLGCIEVHFESQ